MRSYISSALVAVLALAGFALPAKAQNLDLNEVAAALALPIVTSTSFGGFDDRRPGPRNRHDTVTSIVVTNTSSSAVRLGVQVISGDRRDYWAANSFDCVVTGQETTEFFFIANGRGESKVSFECSTPDATGDSRYEDLNIYRTETVEAETGIMWIYAQTIGGQTSSNDVLVGESTVIDLTAGSAYSVGAIPFQGMDPLAQDGNLQFRFDGLEYAQFPSVLTSNFHAPAFGEGRGIDADLILFTLDGTITSEPPRARLKVNFYNDDERHRDAAYEFDCFDIVPLTKIDSRFDAFKLGSFVGNLELIPQPTNAPNLAHDLLFDGPTVDGVRNSPVHGWLVQTLHGDCKRPGPGKIEDAPSRDDMYKCMENDAAWGKQLDQSGFSHVPTPFDTPVLNAN